MLRKLIPVVGAILIGAPFASADILWNNRSAGGVAAGITSGDVFTNFSAGDPAENLYSGVLEDGTFASGAGSYTITGLRIGYNNTNLLNSTTIDARIKFFDTVNYSVGTNTSVNSSQIGAETTLTFVANPGSDETGLLTLTGGPFVIPDNTFGFAVRFVDTGTNNPSSTVQYLFKNVPVGVGTSDENFAADQNNDGLYFGGEELTWAVPDQFPAANLYLERIGTFSPAAVPEPASLGLLSLFGLGLLRRKR